jgi:uncharacterized membrane protein
MWQIMWMLTLLPNWLWHAITISGVVAVFAAWFLSRIPFINQYSAILKLVGTVAVLVGIWVEGGMSNNAMWEAKVADLEAKVKIAEAQSVKANEELDKKTKEKIKVVKEVQVVIKEKIVKVASKIDADCKVDPEAIEIINDAAKNQVRSKK